MWPSTDLTAAARTARRRWMRLMGLMGLGLLPGLALIPAQAAEPRIQPFSVATWTSLQAGLPRPAIVVFTRTSCAVCPEVFEALRQTIRARGRPAPLVAVFLDGDGLTAGHAGHLMGPVDRIYAYRGQEAALRHAVDPSWRGVTPYVALLAADGTQALVAGMPDADRLARWEVSAQRR